jgi:hypothetical protein
VHFPRSARPHHGVLDIVTNLAIACVSKKMKSSVDIGLVDSVQALSASVSVPQSGASSVPSRFGFVSKGSQPQPHTGALPLTPTRDTNITSATAATAATAAAAFIEQNRADNSSGNNHSREKGSCGVPEVVRILSYPLLSPDGHWALGVMQVATPY